MEGYNEIMGTLLWSSYATQREAGMSHEGTVRIGLAKPELLEKFKKVYEELKSKKS